MYLTEENVSFDNGRGVTLRGVLALPKKDAPIVLLCHGLGSRKDGMKMSSLVAPLAAAGIGSLRFDFFGHGESGGDFADLTLTEGVDDVVQAYRFVRARFPHARIGLVGDSFGGGSVFFALPSLDGAAGALLTAPAVLYFEAKRKQLGVLGSLAWRVLGRIWYRTHRSGRRRPLKYAFYRSLAAHDGRASAKMVPVPVRILHGDKDGKIPLAHSVEIVALLPKGDLVTFPGVGHSFRDPAAHERRIEETVCFFAELFALDTRA